MLSTKAPQKQQTTEPANLYFEGEFDGKIGLKATNPDNDSYWDGYQKGLRSYYLAQKSRN